MKVPGPASAPHSAPPFPCHICGGAAHPLALYPGFSRVSSDCLPWTAGGVLGICLGCGALVVRADAQWNADCDAIYRGYRIYHQSGGVEQVVAQAAASEPAGRSRVLVEKMHGGFPVPSRGRLLDVGCGNGGFLRSFTERFPEWTAVGSEFDAKHRQEIESIAGVEQLHVGPLAELSGGFDLISLIHVLEHIQDPARLLAELAGLLRPGGRLLIQLPYYVQNPVELLIADHATHFSGSSLQGLLERCGWVPCRITSDWIPKELSCVAELRSEKTSPPPRPVAEEDVRLPEDAVAWIEAFRTKARAAAAGARTNGRAFGIFGTAIAGVWLSGELRDSAQFFVDEDPARVGKLLHGIPVVAPGAIPAHATVFMGVSAVIADRIARRIQRDDLDLVSPPPNPC